MLSIAAVVSLALDFFGSTPHVDHEPPVDWVDRIAIMIAIAIVVCMASPDSIPPTVVIRMLAKEERGLKVIRDGLEKIVDIKVRFS